MAAGIAVANAVCCRSACRSMSRRIETFILRCGPWRGRRESHETLNLFPKVSGNVTGRAYDLLKVLHGRSPGRGGQPQRWHLETRGWRGESSG